MAGVDSNSDPREGLATSQQPNEKAESLHGMDSKKRHQSSSPVIDPEDRTRSGQRKCAKDDETDQGALLIERPARPELTENKGSANLIYSAPITPLGNRPPRNDSDSDTPGLNDSLFDRLLNWKEAVNEARKKSLVGHANLLITPMVKSVFGSSHDSKMGDVGQGIAGAEAPVNIQAKQGDDGAHENNLFLRALSLSIDSLQGSMNKNTATINKNSESVASVLERITRVEHSFHSSIGGLEEKVNAVENTSSEMAKLVQDMKAYADSKVNQLRLAIPSTLADIENDFDDKLKSHTDATIELVKSEIDMNTCRPSQLRKCEIN